MRVDHYELRQVPRQLMDGIACNVTQALLACSALCTVHSELCSSPLSWLELCRRPHVHVAPFQRDEHGGSEKEGTRYVRNRKLRLLPWYTAHGRNCPFPRSTAMQCGHVSALHTHRTTVTHTHRSHIPSPDTARHRSALPGAARRVTRGGKRNVVFVVLALVAY